MRPINSNFNGSKTLLAIVASTLMLNPITLIFLTNQILLSILISLFFLSTTIAIFRISKNSRLKIYYFNLLLLISLCYHLELIYTLKFKEYIIPNIYTIEKNYFFNQPNLNQKFEDQEYQTRYITNYQGYRIQSEMDQLTKIDSCDWLFLGDSFTQGAQVDYEDLFTTQLYKKFPDKILLNAGISGFSIVDEFNYYKSAGFKLKPKKVILQICIFNDFMNVSQNEIGISEYLMQYSNLYRQIAYNLKYSSREALPLNRWTEPFYSDEKNNIDYNIFYKKKSRKKSQDIENFIQYLDKFKCETQKNKSELVVILIPTKEQLYYNYFSEVIDKFKIDISQVDLLLPNKLMDSLATKIDFKLIDLYEKFSNSKEKVFFDIDEHLNKIGHKEISEVLAKYFKKDSSIFNCLSARNKGERYPTSINGGKDIMYQSSVDGNFQILVSDTLFTKYELLRWSKIDKIHPNISENYLTYTLGDQNFSKTDIVLEDLITKDVQIITEGENNFGAIPSLSHNGLFLVYAGWHNIENRLTNPTIELYNIKEKKSQTITIDKYESWRPFFHPSDSIIYYISKEFQNRFAIYSYNLHSGIKNAVLKTKFEIWDPSISPDGNLLVLSGFVDKNWDLFLFNFKKNELKRLTYTIGNEWDASFSKDGKKIFFAGTFGFNNGIYSLKIK